MTRTRARLTVAVATLATLGLAASCAPPTPPAAESYSFEGTRVTVDDSQDETCVIICVNRSDEPYLINIGFRVKVGVPNSADAFVVNARSSAPQDVGAGESVNLTGARRAEARFDDLRPLDVPDLLDPANALEVIGVYTWAAEEDFVGLGVAANGTADILEDALNSTVAQATLPSDVGIIFDLILDNILDSLGLLAQNIPLFGLGDDVLGGGLYLGIGAKGGLASIIDGAIAGTPPITFDIPIVTLPPDIQGGGFFTTSGNRSFTQSFSGAGGRHTYDFAVVRN